MQSGAKKRVEAKLVRRSVSRASLLTILYIVAATAVVASCLGMLLWGANRGYAAITERGEIQLYPATAIWFTMAGLIGFCVAFLTCERFHALLLGPPPGVLSPEYLLAAGSVPRVLRRAYIVALVALSLIAILNVRKHAVLTASAIIEQRALALSPRQYRYSDVDQITMSRYFIPATRYRRAGVSTARSVFVWLRGGKRWSLKDSELTTTDQEELATYLAARCGLPVEYPEAVLDVPDPKEVARRGRLVLVYFSVAAVVLVLAIAVKKFAVPR